jgi:hydroxymethylbilane synthase
MSIPPLRIATRGSALALWQAEYTRRALLAQRPEQPVELLVLKTQGDKILDRPLYAVGGKGLFTKEIEEALLDGRADVAVHSLKDLPSEADMHTALHVAAIPPREEASDALVLPAALSPQSAKLSAGQILRQLPPAARVGTSSLRRACQLQLLRPGLQISPLRGNVDTRLRRVDGSASAGSASAGSDDSARLDAVVLASAGLLRLGYGGRISARFTPQEMLPACGQGALALQCRREDGETTARLARLADRAASLAVAAERAFNAALGGSCHTPLSAFAELSPEDQLHIAGFVGSLQAGRSLRAEVAGTVHDGTQARALGQRLADQLLAQGAAELLQPPS